MASRGDLLSVCERNFEFLAVGWRPPIRSRFDQGFQQIGRGGDESGVSLGSRRPRDHIANVVIIHLALDAESGRFSDGAGR